LLNISLEQIASLIGAQLNGSPKHMVDSCATLDAANSNQLSFIYDKKYLAALKQTKAGVVILSTEFAEDCQVNALIVDNPYLAYAQAATLISSTKAATQRVHPSAVIGEHVKMADDCTVSANAVMAIMLRLAKI